MNYLISVYLFIIGAACGSFALVLVDRMRAKKDWVKGRSCCDSCNKTLSPLELIPIASWLIQRGRCRSCKEKISPAFLLSELLCGGLFVISYVFLPYELSSVGAYLKFALWLISCLLMVSLIIFDLRWFLLPTKIVYAIAILGLLHRGIVIFSERSENSVLWGFVMSVLSVLVGSGFFWVLHELSKGKWIGDGDVRFGLVIGLFASSPLEAWLTIFLASILGLLFSTKELVRPSANKKKIKSMKIPFGPYLIVALFIVYLFGARLVSWYLDKMIFA